MYVKTTILATIDADDSVDSFCPGAMLYVEPPDAEGPTFRGHAMPRASRHPRGNRIGVICPTQSQVVQALVDFGIVRFEVIVVGVAKTLLPYTTTGDIAVVGDDIIGRVVSLWYPTRVPFDLERPPQGMSCAIVALSPSE